MAEFGPLQALWGGFATFWSIWQACIMQITPFFVAFMASLFLITTERRGKYEGFLLPPVFFTFGFAISFSLMHSPLFMSVNPVPTWLLKIASGIYILATGVLLFSRAVHLVKDWLYWAGGFLLGITFGIIYMPCISPSLSKIFTIAMQPDSMTTGLLLAFLYAVGLGISLIIAGLVVIGILHTTGVYRRHNASLRKFFSVFLIILGLLNITGYMVYYKSLILKPFIK